MNTHQESKKTRGLPERWQDTTDDKLRRLNRGLGPSQRQALENMGCADALLPQVTTPSQNLDKGRCVRQYLDQIHEDIRRTGTIGDVANYCVGRVRVVADPERFFNENSGLIADRKSAANAERFRKQW